MVVAAVGADTVVPPTIAIGKVLVVLVRILGAGAIRTIKPVAVGLVDILVGNGADGIVKFGGNVTTLAGPRVTVSTVALRPDVLAIIDMHAPVNSGVALTTVTLGTERLRGVTVVAGLDHRSVVKVGRGCKDSEPHGEDGSKEGNRDHFGGNERLGQR